jgi:hypothetical protein
MTNQAILEIIILISNGKQMVPTLLFQEKTFLNAKGLIQVHRLKT